MSQYAYMTKVSKAVAMRRFMIEATKLIKDMQDELLFCQDKFDVNPYFDLFNSTEYIPSVILKSFAANTGIDCFYNATQQKDLMNCTFRFSVVVFDKGKFLILEKRNCITTKDFFVHFSKTLQEP